MGSSGARLLVARQEAAAAPAHLRGPRGAPPRPTPPALPGRGHPAEIRRRIQADAVAHARQALDKPDLPVRLELRLASASQRDLR